jgi:hypothetical protein
MFAISFLVPIGVPCVRVGRSLCWGSNEMKAYHYLVDDVFIDVYTQKGGKGLGIQSDVFGPQENVILYAEVAENTAPAQDETVQFVIRGPRNPYQNYSTILQAETNASGISSTSFRIPWIIPHAEEISFGIWNVVATVDLGGQVICDSVTFEVGYIVDIISVVTGTLLDETYWIPRVNFTKEKCMDVRLVAKNIAFTPKNIWFCITCCDKDNVAIAYVVSKNAILEKTTEEFFLQIVCIPKFAGVGKATVYAGALDDPPWEGGVPYCLEKTAKILIMEGIADATSPFINDALREPEVVQPYQEVIVSASVTDSKSGVQEVILCYRVDDSSKWVNVKMNETAEDAFVGNIPGFAAETNVSYVVIAYDYVGNFVVDNKGGQYYVFTVVPEFSSIHALLLVIVFTTIVIAKKKSRYLL